MVFAGRLPRWFAVACLIVLPLWTAGCGGTSSQSASTPPATTPPPTTSTGNAAPAITSLSPSSVTAGSLDLSITVVGTGFVSQSAVQWNGMLLATAFGSSTSLTASIPADKLLDGAVAFVTVSSPAPGGGTSQGVSFSVNNPVPTVPSVSPAGVLAGSAGAMLDVSGTGFVPSSVVAWNGVPLATSWVSGSEIRAALPASALTASGTGGLTVRNPAPSGGSSNVMTLDVDGPMPILTGIFPTVVPVGKAASIMLMGRGFVANSVALWNGSARPTTFVSATTLQVALSANDLASTGPGSLSVNNPGPHSATSGTQTLQSSSQPFPAIASAVITTAPASCSQLQLTLTGTDFSTYSTIQVNGIPLPTQYYGGDLSRISDVLPSGLVTKPGNTNITVTNPGGLTSPPYSYPSSNPPALALCPTAVTVFPSSSFTIQVLPTEVNAPGGEQLTVGDLPSGLTVAAKTVPMPTTGAVLHFQAASTLTPGTYNISLQGTAGTVVANATLPLTVSAGPVPTFALIPSATEVAVPIGGSASVTFSAFSNGGGLAPADFDITASLSGLPPGISAAIAPTVISPGQNVTVTLTAAVNAPVTQNTTVTLTGTPSAAVASASTTFLVDVVQPPGSLTDNRTDFTSIGGTPYAAAYDAAHDLIFASNPDWNRVDVLSNKTHQVIKQIPVFNPRGIDITPDQSRVWVGTDSRRMVAIDTGRLTATHYTLPAFQNADWVATTIDALSDGTVLIPIESRDYGGIDAAVVWNPANNTLTQLNVPSGAAPGTRVGSFLRSGDGTKAYSVSSDSMNCQILMYDVATQTMSAGAQLNEACGFYAVNQDGSRLVLANNAGVGLYDASLHLLGTLFPDSPQTVGYFQGTFFFSRDGTKLYKVASSRITTYDTASVSPIGVAPSIGWPYTTSGDQTSLATFAVDANGMLLETQTFGIAFEDATFYQNFGANTMQPQSIVSIGTYSGPLSGGTLVSPYPIFNLIPDVWFGGARGTVNAAGSGTITVTSPPSSTPGPVNMKYLLPDGVEYFDPQVFTYSAYPQYAVLSAGSPDGGAPGRITGYGLPDDASGGSITVGINSATITSQKQQYRASDGEPFPATNLDFTIPQGSPGFADISVTTPAGTGTLQSGFYYAKSVTDYSTPDRFTAIVADPKRQQVYLTAVDHVDVFSTSSEHFTTPIHPAAFGTKQQFTGLGLTPDGSQLLITNLLDGSLAVVNPDASASSFAIRIAPVNYVVNNCANGPMYVAATSDHRAFVATGSLPAPSCPGDGVLYIANLQTRTVTQPAGGGGQCHLVSPSPQFPDAFSVQASSDGNVISTTSCIYSVPANSYFGLNLPDAVGAAISGDANVLAAYNAFAGPDGARVGMIAQPLPLYQNPVSQPAVPLYHAQLNASGSLYYIPYAHYFEIVDVFHGRLLMRFSLTETIQPGSSPLAIDAGGQHVYLATDKGLTVVDLGQAPLAVGHLSQSSAGVGTAVTVRGSGFDSSVTATVGGQPALASVTDENTLTLTVPAIASGPAEIVLTRGDGASYRYENGIVLP